MVFVFMALISRGMNTWGFHIQDDYPFVYPFVHISYSGSIFMVILVSFERYLAVCQGTQLTIPKAKFYIGVVTIVSILVNIPSMLVYKWSEGHTKLTDMACDELFIKYYITYFLNLTLRFIFPTISLIGFNVLIYQKVNDISRVFLQRQLWIVNYGLSIIATKSSSKNLSNQNKHLCLCCLQYKT